VHGAGAVHRLGLLAAAGREEEVHRAVAAHLAADHALQALRLEGVCAQDDLARALGRGWPRGRPWWLHDERMAAPLVTLHPDGHEAWLASRSSSLRKTFGKQRRRLERSGGAVRVVRGTDEARAAVAELVRLHRAQWGPLGIDGPTAAALGAAVETLGERLRLQVLELDGAVRAVELQLVAGRVGQAVVGAFEPVAGLSPGLLTLEAALRDAHERGLAVLDLGGGDQPYKARLADGDAPLSWWTLLPPGVRGVRGAAREAPRLGRTLARRARGRLRRADGAAAQASR
jgi:CelD/BcsL family acetyltransferase involved in cellulose biosynthesis